MAYPERYSPYRDHPPAHMPDPERGRRMVGLVLYVFGMIAGAILLVLLFFVGGIIGALGYLAIGFAVLVPGALALLLVSHRPLLADLGARAGGARLTTLHP